MSLVSTLQISLVDWLTYRNRLTLGLWYLMAKWETVVAVEREETKTEGVVDTAMDGE